MARALTSEILIVAGLLSGNGFYDELMSKASNLVKEKGKGCLSHFSYFVLENYHYYDQEIPPPEYIQQLLFQN